jgi:hypothetical protein
MIHLITSLYQEKNDKRWDELMFCLNQNILNLLIDKIHVFKEGNLDVQKIPVNKKINIVEINKRPFISDFINYANQLGTNDFKIISNSDIFFENSIGKVYTQWRDNNIYSLTRWDYLNQGEYSFYENYKSQDVWIFKNKIPENIGVYYLGIPGCDNRFAKELNACNFKISNPSLSIKTIHVHQSEVRNYTIGKDRVNGEYKYLIPIYFRGDKSESNEEIHKKLLLNYLHRKYKNNLEGSNFSIFSRIFSFITLQILKLYYNLF